MISESEAICSLKHNGFDQSTESEAPMHEGVSRLPSSFLYIGPLCGCDKICKGLMHIKIE